MKGDMHDPKALIREAYQIDGITLEECRSIFVDWALSVESADIQAHLAHLLETYAAHGADHPMTLVLAEGTKAAPATGRRGGRAARVPNS